MASTNTTIIETNAAQANATLRLSIRGEKKLLDIQDRVAREESVRKDRVVQDEKDRKDRAARAEKDRKDRESAASMKLEAEKFIHQKRMDMLKLLPQDERTRYINVSLKLLQNDAHTPCIAHNNTYLHTQEMSGRKSTAESLEQQKKRSRTKTDKYGFPNRENHKPCKDKVKFTVHGVVEHMEKSENWKLDTQCRGGNRKLVSYKGAWYKITKTKKEIKVWVNGSNVVNGPDNFVKVLYSSNASNCKELTKDLWKRVENVIVRQYNQGVRPQKEDMSGAKAELQERPKKKRKRQHLNLRSSNNNVSHPTSGPSSSVNVNYIPGDRKVSSRALSTNTLNPVSPKKLKKFLQIKKAVYNSAISSKPLMGNRGWYTYLYQECNWDYEKTYSIFNDFLKVYSNLFLKEQKIRSNKSVLYYTRM